MYHQYVNSYYCEYLQVLYNAYLLCFSYGFTFTPIKYSFGLDRLLEVVVEYRIVR